MANKRFGSIQGLVARGTRLDDCGGLVEGATGTATSGFVQIGLSANVDEGETFQVKTADGVLCINEKECPALSWYDVDSEFCQVDPHYFEMMGNVATITDVRGDSVGYQVTDDRVCNNAALEVWTKVAGSACGSSDCGPDTRERWLYWLTPWVTNGIMGDFEISNGALSFSMSGNTKGNPQWGQGPYNVVCLDEEDPGDPLTLCDTAGPLADDPVLPNAHLYKRLTKIAPPTNECGYQSLVAVDPVDLGSS